MGKTFRPWDVDQAQLFPPSVKDLVPPGHLAHFVRDLVRDEIDLSAILGAYTEERGHPPYHPALMTALLLYGYSRGIYSSRKLEQACEERVDFMAVTGMAKPDHSRISEFRRRHLDALKGLFVQVLLLCREAGLVKLGHVALDGSKMKANASKHAAMSYGRMKKAEPELAAEVERWLGEAEATDAREEADLGSRRGDEMPSWVGNKQRRLERIREAKKRIETQAKEEAEGVAAERDRLERERGEPLKGRAPKALDGVPEDKAQSNFTDPESRIMKTRDGYEQAYNCQAAVDAASQVIVAEHVTAKQNDCDELVPLIDAIERTTGDVPSEVSADAGYCSETNIAVLRERGIRGFVATGRQRHGAASATDDEKNRNGPLRRAMRTRLRRGGWRSRYRLRKQTVEPVFGQIKEARGFRRFLLRGIAKVSAEWGLLCTVHNLLKLAAARRAGLN